MDPPRILIADDHDLMRAGTRALLESRADWKVCGECSNGREAVEMAEKLAPDIAILDVSMPELNGLEAVRQIRHNSPATEVLIYTGLESDELILEVFEAGARSYIQKAEPAEQLLAAVEALAAHKPYFSARASEVVFSRYLQKVPKSVEMEPMKGRLTARERELVQLLAEGKSNKEAASVLHISAKTVETHRAAIMKKLQLHSFSDLVRYAIRNKIVEA